MAIIQIEELVKVYEGQPTVMGINLDVNSNEALALIGPTGSGKTTVIRMMDLLEPPTSGRIIFDSVDVTRSRRERLKARRRMSYVQQKPVVFTMTVYDNIAFALKWRRVHRQDIARRVKEALETVEMGDYSRRDARTLSGGETQRLAIARALVTEPEVLFLDEPTANLDPVSTAKVEKVIQNVIRQKRTAVVMATHDMLVGQKLAARIGVILEGRLEQVGTPREIFGSPGSRKLAEFVGVENMLQGKVAEKDNCEIQVSVDGQKIYAVCDHLEQNDVYVLIRAEDIILSPSRHKSSAKNVFSGKITDISQLGPLVRVEMDCGFPLVGLVTRSSAAELQLDTSKQVYASFKASATHLINKLT